VYNDYFNENLKSHKTVIVGCKKKLKCLKQKLDEKRKLSIRLDKDTNVTNHQTGHCDDCGDSKTVQ